MVSFLSLGPIVMLRAGTNITFDFKVTSQPWFTCEQCNSELQSEGKKVRLMLCVHCAKRCHDGADSASVSLVFRTSNVTATPSTWPFRDGVRPTQDIAGSST